jgi:NAD(P)-dependent dehydrogenase (short-subunit alcohol dehydrogenase family)
VALVDFNVAWANETKRMIVEEGSGGESGSNVIVVQADVTDEDSCKRAVETTVEVFGAVHILVNIGRSIPFFNALLSKPSILCTYRGIVGVGGAMGDATNINLEAWDRDFRINVTSMVLMARYAIPEMRKQGRGSIVNMSSVSGCEFSSSLLAHTISSIFLRASDKFNGAGLTILGTQVLGGNPSLLYPTTKGAIIQMTRAMAAQHGREGIRVNCVAPGMVYTPMTRGRGMTEEMRDARIRQNLLGIEGTGWDVGYGEFAQS